MNTRTILLPLTAALLLAACGQQNSQDAQMAENAKQIEILRQQAEIQKLQNELSAQAASAEQVYQLTASAVAQTIPAAAQAAAKAGDIVQGTDGQQYLYDAVQRVHRDYRVKHPSNIASPRSQIHPNAPINRPSGTPNYRSTNKGYSNTRSFGFGGRRRR